MKAELGSREGGLHNAPLPLQGLRLTVADFLGAFGVEGRGSANYFSRYPRVDPFPRYAGVCLGSRTGQIAGRRKQKAFFSLLFPLSLSTFVSVPSTQRASTTLNHAIYGTHDPNDRASPAINTRPEMEKGSLEVCIAPGKHGSGGRGGNVTTGGYTKVSIAGFADVVSGSARIRTILFLLDTVPGRVLSLYPFPFLFLPFYFLSI